MKEKVPEERIETLRQEILALLENRELSIGDLSKAIGKSEKELYGHIENLSIYKSLKIISAECVKCGFVFEGRYRAKKPGKCPKCKGTRIDPPLFTYITE